MTDLLTAEDVRAAWDALTIAQQRTVLSVLGLTVRIMPTRQGRGFDPRSVEFDWPRPALRCWPAGPEARTEQLGEPGSSLGVSLS